MSLRGSGLCISCEGVLMPLLKLSAVYAPSPEAGFDVVIRGPMGGVLETLKSLGFEGVELNIPNPFEVDVAGLRGVVKATGLEVSAISTGLSYIRYGYSLSSPEEGVRGESIRFFRKYIDLSVELGCGKVVVGLARGRCGSAGCGRALETLRSSMEVLDEYAYGRGVTLVLEPLNRYETDLINRVSEALEFVKPFRSVKLLIDTFHSTLEERSPYEAIEVAGPYIAHVHVADSNRLAPGLGIIDWERVIYRLVKVGYRGYLSVEARAVPSYEELLRVSARTLKPLLI